MKLFTKSVFTIALVLLLTPALIGQQSLYDTMHLFAEPPPPPTARAGYVGAFGNVNLYYWVAARYPSGMATPGQPILAGNTVGIANLDGTHYVQLGWRPCPGATGYYVIRTTTPYWTGTCVNCVVLTNSALTSFADQGGGTTNWPVAGVSSVREANWHLTLDNLQEADPYLKTLMNGAVQGRLLFTEPPYGLDFDGDTTITTTIRGQNGSTFDNDAAYLWLSDSEIRVAGPADAFLDWSARTDASVYGFRSRISSDMTGGTTGVYGANFNAQANPAAAGGAFIGVRGTATQITGATGTDVLDGVYGESNPADGLIYGTYGVFGILNIDDATTAGVNWMGAGVKGDYDDAVGLASATTYEAGVMGVIADQATVGPDGAVVALLMGGGTRTPPYAPSSAFRVVDLADMASVSFDYGFDAYWTDGAGLDTVFNIADIRGQAMAMLNNDGAESWELLGASLDYADVAASNTTLEDKTVLGTESLANIADFSQATWALAGDFAVVGTDATFTYATGVGTVTQSSGGNLAIDGIGYQRYRLDYTIAITPTVVGAVLTLTNAFGLAAVTLPITSGLNTVYFDSAVAPANFVFDVAGATSGVFTIESATLKQIQGGDLLTRGTIRPVSVTFADLPAAVNGTMLFCVDCDPAAAGAGPTVCSSAGTKTGAFAFRAAGAWTCLGI